MKIGFTGSRNGVKPEQERNIEESLLLLNPTEAHHGDCLGADADFHAVCTRHRIPVVLHPPSDGSKRAHCEPVLLTRNPQPFLKRNQQIVLATEVLIASVSGAEQTRSGTWATIRFARTKRRPIVIVFGDGTCLLENWPERLQKLCESTFNPPKHS